MEICIKIVSFLISMLFVFFGFFFYQKNTQIDNHIEESGTTICTISTVEVEKNSNSTTTTKIVISTTKKEKEVTSTKITEKSTKAETSSTAKSTTALTTKHKTSQSTSEKLKYLGRFKLTAYCPCSQCSGQWAGITATGVTAKQNHTIAVDPSVIRYGSHIQINGKEYVAEDCGGGVKGQHIDIFFNSHKEACDFGVQYADVYLVVD